MNNIRITRIYINNKYAFLTQFKNRKKKNRKNLFDPKFIRSAEMGIDHV